jgi:hypothetical protein
MRCRMPVTPAKLPRKKMHKGVNAANRQLAENSARPARRPPKRRQRYSGKGHIITHFRAYAETVLGDGMPQIAARTGI